MCRTDLPARREVGQTQWHAGMLCHQLKNTVVKAIQGQPQPMAEVILTPEVGVLE
jgi:hypothetical protein